MFEAFLYAGFVAMAFGWWGANTAAGRRRFDGMAAIVPIGALVLGTLLFAAGLYLFVRR